MTRSLIDELFSHSYGARSSGHAHRGSSHTVWVHAFGFTRVHARTPFGFVPRADGTAAITG